MILKLAWRNIWRNKRRTLITAAMIFLAVMLAIIMQSVQKGVYDRNIDNLVMYSTGYIQVNAEGHQEDKTLETSVEYNQELVDKITSVPGVKGVLPKIVNVGLTATDSVSKETMINAIDPELEDKATGLADRVIAGEYLKPGDKSIMIGDAMAKRLKVEVGDTLVLLSIGYHQISANGLFPVKGIVTLGSPELSKRMMYMSLDMAQDLFLLDNRVSNISVLLNDKRDFKEIAENIREELGEDYEVMDWEELVPELAQLAKGEEQSGILIMMILYLIISFGVFGTVLMMLAERKREFGVVTSIGMKRRKLAIIVVLENAIISAIGVVIGMILASPLVAYLKHQPVSLAGDMKESYEKLGFEPVITADFYTDVFVNNAGTIFFIAILLSIYPLIKIMRIKPIENLRS